MDVWETVVAGSTLEHGDFWEHLNAQGGLGSELIIVHADGLEVMVLDDIEVSMDNSDIAVAINEEIKVTIDNAPLEVNT